MRIETTKKLFTVDEYYRMDDAGIFKPDARLELIEGEIFEMSAIGNRHAACVNSAMALFAEAFGKRAIVSGQNPVLLSNYSVP
ncbi:MAG TPA: Uma2 family endonuclease, partial [Terriglobia bacterium]|nr:Uma2 family endonuclease [Terriglobia bacterium]